MSPGCSGYWVSVKYKLVVVDLDGTLLTPEHRVGEYTRRVLSDLCERGVGLVLASGRHFHDVYAVSKQFGNGIYTISSNGAAVHDGNGELLEMTAVENDCLDFLISDRAFASVHTNLYCVQEWLVEQPDPTLLKYHKESGFTYRVVDFRSLGAEPVLKVFFYGECSLLRELERYILERCSARLATTFSIPIALEVMAVGVSKGTALERVCGHRGIDLSEVIAFGDGLNDLELLRTAGTGVLMGNADPKLKAALTGNPVIGGNSEEAVARFLEGVLE